MVGPYNPHLSKQFQAHINVEYCNSVKSIKYVFRYVNKGSDIAVFSITRENREQHPKDEILQYQIGRYLNSNETACRILGFPIHDRELAVTQLLVHLDNGHLVYFTDRCNMPMYDHIIHVMQQDESFNEESRELQSKVTKESSKVWKWDECTRCIQNMLSAFISECYNVKFVDQHVSQILKKSMDMSVKRTSISAFRITGK